MHTFRLPYGEMAPTLQDISYLLGLPLVSTAVGPRVVPPTWLDDLEARFADIDREVVVGLLEPHPRGGRLASPSKKWLLQFSNLEFNVIHALFFSAGTNVG